MLEMTTKGLYCKAGDFFIDPSRAVDTALVTHAHSDHARKGSRRYLCERSGMRLLAHRVGGAAEITGMEYGQTLSFGEVRVSFHSAGHILGSAQIRIEHEGKVWVVSGDYKRDRDPTCLPFEVVKCDTFVTEATFGNPRYAWSSSDEVAAEIHSWWMANRRQGKSSVLFCYALGKTQRVLGGLADHTEEPVFVFGEGHSMTELYRQEGIRMVPTVRLEDVGNARALRGGLVVAPHSLARTPWMRRLGDFETAFASGWMQTGAFGLYRSYDRGFVLSDHADFPTLVRTVEETGARRVLVLHAREGKGLIQHLRLKGIDASPFSASEKQMAELSPVQGSLF